MTEKLLTTEDVAEMLNFAPYTVAKYRMKGIGPKYILIGRKLIRYRKSDVEEWIQEKIQKI